MPERDEEPTLLANLHPADWVNPEPTGRYNLVVVGAGTAGLVCAAGAAGLGAKVALIERHLLGGDCLNYGCVPSKGIIRAARAFNEVVNGSAFGISGTHDAVIDFGSVMGRMEEVRGALSPHDSARRFRDDLGVDLFFGNGRFTSRETIAVSGSTLRFRKAAICTGTRAAAPALPGLAEAGFLTNETVFSLRDLPLRVAIIGGGPVGCELAQAFARLGSLVTLLVSGTQILPREDPDGAAAVHRAFVRDGIDVRFTASLKWVESDARGKVIVLERAGKGEEVVVDEIVVGVGRAPNVEDLGLPEAGIVFDVKEGVKVDERLRTSNGNIYAAGDVCSPYKFTHSADALARILIANALFSGRRRTSALTIPWCTFTDPEVAHVGLYEHEAQARGLKVTTLTLPMSDVDRARLDGEDEGFVRVHLKKGSDTILGATIVARHAGEMISEFSLAITNGLGLSAIGRTIHPYPTHAEAAKKVADAWNRTRLTPPVKRLLALWLRWQRR